MKTSQRTSYLLARPDRFAQAGRLKLRSYQEQAIQAVADGVRRRDGLRFVWIFPRQSGKDEALAILVQYLLTLFKQEGGEMVFFNPTFKPQTETSMRRLECRLDGNPLTMGRWKRRSGYIYQLGKAYCTYLSADPTAHVVSATANRLLVVNEAQDIAILKYDKDIDPMAASSHAAILFAGTRWTETTLLEREYQQALEAQKQDGRQRVFFFTANDVRKCVPEYGRHVDEAETRLGRQHPLVKTQFFCETINGEAGMFPPDRLALMQGSHSLRIEAEPGKDYAFLIDVAGQDESRMAGEDGLQNLERDATNLKIVQVETEANDLVGKPTYLVVFRKQWIGESHVKVFGALRLLVQTWKPERILIDATGVGEGLWSMLHNAFGEQIVKPVKFTPKLKSGLGYGFLALIESGRYREYCPLDKVLRLQMEKCRSQIMPGPGKLMRWGVPDGTRDEHGEAVHDDDLMTAALCCLLDKDDWEPACQETTPLIVRVRDPLEDMDSSF